MKKKQLEELAKKWNQIGKEQPESEEKSGKAPEGKPK